MYTTLENTPIEIDLLKQGKSTGWSIVGNTAVHEACNSGNILLTGFEIISGANYQFSFTATISNGLLRPSVGDTNGVSRTTSGFFTETLTCTGVNPLFKFYATGDCVVEVLDIQNTAQSTSNRLKNTIVWSEENRGWMGYITYTPDVAFSLFTKYFSYKAGIPMVHDPDLLPRNNLYGTQYKTYYQFTANGNKGQTKNFESISYESNQLLITTVDGIVTSLGQVSELIARDFLKDILDDGINTVNVYDAEGIFSASFRKDKRYDINNGPNLKGSYITIELQTTSGDALHLKNVWVNSDISKIGSR